MTTELWKADENREERREYILRVAVTLLGLDASAVAAIEKRLIDRCIWQWTIANGRGGKKFDQQYASAAALKILDTGGKGTLRHEHVYPRKAMVDLIRAERNRVREILTRAVACIVTVDEHQVLHGDKQLDGWHRYRAAGITVIDRATGKKVSLGRLISGNGE